VTTTLAMLSNLSTRSKEEHSDLAAGGGQ